MNEQHHSQAEAPDALEITAQDAPAHRASGTPVPEEGASPHDSPPADADPSMTHEGEGHDTIHPSDVEQASSLSSGGGSPEPADTATTDALPTTAPSPLVGEVEIIEPEARRVPHPPAFAQPNGGVASHTVSEDPIINQLSDLIANRAAAPRKGSYTNSLLADPIKAQRKMMEEAFETCLELHTPTALVDHDALAAEAADLVFHLLVALRTQGMGWAEVEAKLTDRLGKPARHSTY